MNAYSFRYAACDIMNLIAEYEEKVSERYTVLPNVKQGFLIKLIPKNPPLKPDKWEHILRDTEKIILPGLTHWQHSGFHAYFPSAANYEGILADAISGTLAVNGTSWAACPAAVELEVVVTDWLAKAYDLPKKYWHCENNSESGGILMSTASEAALMTMMAAKTNALKYLKSLKENQGLTEPELIEKLVSYVSCEAHSCFQKAAMVCLVTMRVLEVDDNSSLRGTTLQMAIEEDLAKGLHPFYVVGTVGTTSSAAVDNLVEMGQVVKDLRACWFHVDGAYGGNFFICPEKRVPGLEFSDSFGSNTNKGMQINYEGSVLWTSSFEKLGQSLIENKNFPDPQGRNRYEWRHMRISLSKKFKVIGHWISLRSFGVEKLQKCVRNHCDLAKEFEKLVRRDLRFEVVNQVNMGLVCFRITKSDVLTEKLLEEINQSRLLYMIPTTIRNKFVIRFCLIRTNADINDVEFAWKVISEKANKLFSENNDVDRKKENLHTLLTMTTSDELDKIRENTLVDESTPVPEPKERVVMNTLNNDEIDDLPENCMGTYKKFSREL